MYFPPLFAPVRTFEPHSGPLGEPRDTPVLGAAAATRENPLDLSIRPATEAGCEAEATELLMLDHRKLANLAASHSLSAMGRQLATGAAPAAMLDPTLYRLAYGPEALALQAPFCYDRATGVAVPTSLASHQLMTSYLQQRERCIEQQQQAALLAARNSAQQAAVAAAFMDPAALTYGLRTAMTQREAAAALAATRGLYAPTMPTPMVLPAFSLYTDDKGAFTSLRNGSAAEKAYLNGAATQSGVIEAARYAEHLQRLREQHAGKCANACCAGLPGIPSNVSCACCIQPPSGPAICSRSPIGALKEQQQQTAATKGCDFMPFLHRPTVATATSTDLSAPMPNYCSASFTNSSTEVTASTPVFQPATTWSTGLPLVSASGKTAFTVPKKKEVPKVCLPQKETKVLNGNFFEKEQHHHHHHHSNAQELTKKEPEKYVAPYVKKEPVKCREEKEVFVINDAPIVTTHYRREHDVKSLLTPKASTMLSIPKPGIQRQAGIAQTTVTAVTPIVPTKCEGGTIPKTKLPPVLEAYRPVDIMSHNCESYADVPTSLPSPQGPPPLIAVSGKSRQQGRKDSYPYSFADTSAARHQALLHGTPMSNTSPLKCTAANQVCTDLSKKSPKKTIMCPTKDTGLPSYVKDEISKSTPIVIPKPVPQIPSGNYTSHFRPYALQNHPSWVPPANPNVTVSPTVAPQLPKTAVSASTTTTTSSVIISPNHKVVKSEPLPVVSNVKKEQEYDHNANVLQSLLIRRGQTNGSGLMMPHRGPFSILDYHQYHQQLAQHGLNVPHPFPPMDCSGTSTVPTVEKAEPTKVECGNGLDCVGIKHAKKRILETSPTKCDDVSEDKKKIAKMEYPIQHGYNFQYPPYSVADAKPMPVCPYTFVPEPPGYYEKQMALPKQIRPYKTTACGIIKCDEVEQIQTDSIITKFACSGPAEMVNAIHAPPSLGFHLKNLNRMAQARARSKLLRKVLYRLFYNRRKTVVQEEVQPLVTVETPQKYVYRRRIRSGLDMALKKNKKRPGVMYKIRRQKINKVSSGLMMPAEMKKIIVNKALGETVLHRASRMGYPDVVAYCLETNCGNVNARDNAGYTPLHECCSRGHLEIARALLQYGADVNASAAGGIRPLHDAVENDHVEIVRLLLSFGADPCIATYSGLTPNKLARSPLMAEFLQGFMADISSEIDCRPHLPWRFWGSTCCLDPVESGFNMFDDIPNDDENETEGDGSDFLFEVSDSPHLPTFRLSLNRPSSPNKTHYNYLRLSDVLRKTSMTRAFFMEHCQHIEVFSLSRHEFEASATCSQLLTGSKLDTILNTRPFQERLDNNHHLVELVKLDHNIRKVLGIETVSVR